jgi:hypothetical protein
MFLLTWTWIRSDTKGRNVCSLFMECSTKVVCTAEMWSSLYCVLHRCGPHCIVYSNLHFIYTRKNVSHRPEHRLVFRTAGDAAPEFMRCGYQGDAPESNGSCITIFSNKVSGVRTGRLCHGLWFWNPPNFICTQSTNVFLVNNLFPLRTSPYAHSITAARYAHSMKAARYANSITPAHYAHSISATYYAQGTTAARYAHCMKAARYASSITAAHYAHILSVAQYAHGTTAAHYAHSLSVA